MSQRCARVHTGAVWDARAERVRREIATLATSAVSVTDLHTAALDIVRAVVPFAQACWAAVDPDTLVMTAVTNRPSWQVPDEYLARYAEAEYAGTDPNPFAELSRRDEPVARLSDAPHRDVVRSVRLNDLLRPQSLEHELRGAFLVDGTCWAVGGMFREPGSDFTDREVEFLGAIGATLAASTRIAVRAERRHPRGTDGPVILLAGPDGGLHAATSAAATWLAGLEEAAPGRFTMTLYAVAAGARCASNGTARARMRDLDGGWVVLQASRLITGDDPGQMVVTVEAAATNDLVDLLLSAYGATARERQVCVEVLAGRSTADIADRLFISPHTVQDHLKALFAKAGVRSRGELVARLQP